MQRKKGICRVIYYNFPHTVIPYGTQQQTCHTPRLQSNGGTDRRTDRQTPDRYIDRALHTMLTVTTYYVSEGGRINLVSHSNVSVGHEQFVGDYLKLVKI